MPREVMEAICGCDLSLAFEGVTLNALLDTLGLDVGELVAEQLEEVLPSAYILCDTELIPGERCDTGLRELLGEEDEKALDDILVWTRNGFTYTDTDLREDQGEEDVDDILEWTREGFTYTDADLREDQGEKDVDNFLQLTRGGFTQVELRNLISDNGEDPEALKKLDRVRSWLDLARNLWFLPYIGIGLSLASIGFLGGRRWPSRIAWASAVLGIAAAVAYVASVPVYDEVGWEAISDIAGIAASVTEDDPFGAEPNTSSDFEELLGDKAESVARTVASDVVSGIASRALILLLVALAGIGLYIFWPLLFRPAPSEPAPQDEHSSS